MAERTGTVDDDRRDHPQRRVEDLYRLLVDNVRDYAIFVLDAEGRIVSWNRGAERIKGYDEAEVIGQSYAMFYPADSLARGEPARQLEIAAEEGRFEGEVWQVRKDGRWIWAHIVIAALRDEDGTLVGFGKVTGDKTAERNAREALKARERQLADAQQVAHLGSWDWDVAAGHLSWSDELYRIFGLEPGTPVDLDAYTERIHADDRERVLGYIQDAVRTGEPYSFEHRILRPDGEERTVESRGEPVSDADGRVVRLVGTAQDITELREARERERKLAAEQLRREEAEQTATRMGFLAKASQLLGGSLEYEETLRTVAQLAVPEFADWCAVDILGPQGVLERLGIAHVDPEKVALARSLNERYPPSPDDPAEPVYQVLRTGEALLMSELPQEVLDAAARNEEHGRILRELGLRSAILVPITVRDHALGVITFINAESERPYEQDDLVVAQELAGRAGLAIENAQLHAAEREARRHAEEAGERMARLQAITARLSEAVTTAGVAEVIVEEGVAALGCTYGILALKKEDALQVVRSQGVPEKAIAPFLTMRLDADVPIAEAFRKGVIVTIESEADRDRYPALRELPRLARAVVAVPLRSAGQVMGCLCFGFPDDRAFTREAREFLTSLGDQCAQALDRAWLYEAEHEAREAAEAASQAKSQFLAMMSHELRTPLSAIIGYQELLSEGIVGPITERQQEQLSRIRASAMHLRDLINQILSLSRIEAGKEEVLREELDLAGLARDVVVLLEQEARSKGLPLRLNAPPDPVLIASDSGKIRQILLNLVANAIKFTDEGAVTVTLAATEAEVTVEVRDTGIGISPEDRDKVFEAFTQVDQSMTRRAGGSGLGLPVSQRLAYLLGGRIELESEVGVGTTFTLRIPRTYEAGSVVTAVP